MKKIISAFVKYPFYGKMVILILLLIGGMATLNMKKATFPIVESKEITVSVSYPGATPKEMEEGVTTLIEESIRGIPGIKEFSSKSMENVAIVTITGRSNYDIDELQTEIKNSVDGISNFPAATEKPVVSKRRTTDMAMFLSLQMEGQNLIRLNKLANRIEDDFLASGVVSQVAVYGLPSNLELSVEINETQLRRYNLTISDIQNAISANNIDIHGGKIRNDREEIKVLARNRSVKEDDIKNIVVKSSNDGGLVTVGDLADVTLKFEESPNDSYVRGKRNVTIMISKLSEEDLEDISDFAQSYIESYNTTHEESQIIVLHDFLEVIDGQLSILVSNGIMGIVLVILVLSLLLNFRLSLWVAWGIPASFLGMFIVAYMMGVTINMVTLFGMILIIGILVDDGIVIGENIFTHYEKGKSPRRAAIDGTMEVLPAVLTSVSTTIIAFMPLFFIEGQLKMMYEMAFVVVFALLFSLAEGMFVLPGHLANPKVLKPLRKDSFYSKIRKGADWLILGFRDKFYLPLLYKVMRNKFLTFAVAISLFIITLGLLGGGVIRYTFFPSGPSDIFSIDLALKPGTNKTVTKEKLTWIETKIWEVNKDLKKEYGDTIDYVSITQLQVGSAFSGTESGTHAGLIRVFLNPLDDTKMSDHIIKNAISEKVGKIPEAYKFGVGASNRFGAPVSISLLGYELEQLERAKNMLQAELSKMTSLYNVMDNSQLGNQEIRISLKPEAYTLGLTYNSILQQVRQAYYGGLAQRMQDGKDEIWVYVRYPENNRETIGQLENMQIHTQKGDYPLARVVNFTTKRSLSTINRYKGRREIRVDAYQKDENESTPVILEYIEANILPAIKKEYPGVSFVHQGQQKDTNEQLGSITTYFGLAFLIIVLIIMIHFKSFRQGILVLLMIPFGILGAIWGHGIHGEPFSIMSLWGVIALSGTIINDAIVYLSKYNQNLIEGMKVIDATISAGKQRFRPIFLTTVTTVSGLMPLILEKSEDAKMLIPMAISVAYGILFGTFFILVILPLLVIVFNKLNVRLRRMIKRMEIAPEDVEVAVINYQIEKNLENAMQKEIEESQKGKKTE